MPRSGFDYRLTKDAVARAMHLDVYVNVGRNARAGNTLKLAGAPKRWEDPEHATDVYLPDMRVVASAVDLRDWLVAQKVAGDVDALIQKGYSATTGLPAKVLNRQTRLEEFSNEMKRDREDDDQAEEEAAAAEEPKKGGRKRPKVVLMNRRFEEKSSPNRKRLVRNEDREDEAVQQRREEVKQAAGRKAWLKKYHSLPEGKVIDVTGLDEYGLGSKTIPRPADNLKIYRTAPGLNCVSKSEDGWQRAQEWLQK